MLSNSASYSTDPPPTPSLTCLGLRFPFREGGRGLSAFREGWRGLGILIFLLSLLLAGCSRSPGTAAPTRSEVETYWPTKTWRTSTPEAQGMDAQRLNEMLDTIRENNLTLNSLLIVRNGYIVSETYFGATKPDTKGEIYSVTKSFVATLTGIAIDKGNIQGTDQRVLDFFPGRTVENLDQQKKDMTLEDVLTMRSGLDWEEGDPAIYALYRSSDWVKSMLDEPMKEQPGSQFNYCSGCTHLLSAILQQTTGMSTLDFARQNLFKPLGITDLKWDTDSTRTPIGGWGLQLTPRDMAKLGYLYLKAGVWENRQIVSSEWVKKATQSHTSTDDSRLGYGYQWWTYPSLAAYTALGRYGQTIFVIPGSDLIVVTTAELENHDPIFKLIEQYIVPAIVE